LSKYAKTLFSKWLLWEKTLSNPSSDLFGLFPYSDFLFLPCVNPYSQQTVAQALSCAGTHVIDSEDTDSSTFYSVGEIDLLAVLFGLHPLELLAGSGQDFIALGQFATEQQTKDALRGLIDCARSQSAAAWYADSDHAPESILFFSNRGELARASLMTATRRSGMTRLTILLPSPCCVSMPEQAPSSARGRYHMWSTWLYDDTRVAITTARPLRGSEDGRDDVGDNRLQIWNLRYSTIEREMQLLDAAGNLAVSADGCLLAAYFPATTTIQC